MVPPDVTPHDFIQHIQPSLRFMEQNGKPRYIRFVARTGTNSTGACVGYGCESPDYV